MRYKPFLSHKRAKKEIISLLKEQLCIRGAGGWKDTDELQLGGDFSGDIVNAIDECTGGFIWWGTRDTLDSEVICEVELPTALDRAKRDPSYPVIPVFVELKPTDYDDIAQAIGPAYAKQLIAGNGIVPLSRQSLRDLADDTARRYVKQLVRTLPAGPVTMAVTAFRAPAEEHDLTLDWRSLFDAHERVLQAGAQETIIEALGDIREALQSRARSPKVTVELNVPIALALLIGHEFRWTTQLRVTLVTVNPDGEMLVIDPAPPGDCSWPQPQVADRPGSGPVVLAVSVGAELGAAADRWADENDACRIETLHVGRSPNADPLDADEVKSLAATIARRLNELHAAGVPKHLLLRGPAALGAAVGLAANGSGPTYVPFYDGHSYYSGGVWVG